jgi:hypothetical protein
MNNQASAEEDDDDESLPPTKRQRRDTRLFPVPEEVSNTTTAWLPGEDAELRRLKTFDSRASWKKIGKRLKRSEDECKNRWTIIEHMPAVLPKVQKPVGRPRKSTDSAMPGGAKKRASAQETPKQPNQAVTGIPSTRRVAKPVYQWTTEEEAILQGGRAAGLSWQEIAVRMPLFEDRDPPQRTSSACLQHWAYHKMGDTAASATPSQASRSAGRNVEESLGAPTEEPVEERLPAPAVVRESLIVRLPVGAAAPSIPSAPALRSTAESCIPRTNTSAIESNATTDTEFMPEGDREGQPWTDAEDDQLRQYNRQGWTWRQTASTMGRSLQGVKKRFTRLRDLEKERELERELYECSD